MENEHVDQTETVNKEQTNIDTLLTCPCCGKQTMKVPATIDQVSKQEFLAAILTGTQYTHTYNLFNGDLSITIRQISNKVRDKLIHIANKGLLIEDAEEQHYLNIIMSRLYKLSSIVSITVSTQGDSSKFKVYNIEQVVSDTIDKLINYTDKTQLSAINEHIVDPANVSSVPVYIIDKVLQTHTNQVAVLVQSGFDETFQKGIVHVL